MKSEFKFKDVQKANYVFKYFSENDSVDLKTFVESQKYFEKALQIIRRESTENTKLVIQIKPLEKGSVPFDISLILYSLREIFSPDHVSYAADILEIFAGIITLKKLFGGNKNTRFEPFREDELVIKNDGVEIIVKSKSADLFLTNPTIDKALQKAFQVLNKDEEITGIEILDENKNSLTKVTKDEFQNLIVPNENLQQALQNEDKEFLIQRVEPHFDSPPILKINNPSLVDKIQDANIMEEELTILKIVWDMSSPWQFYRYGTEKVNAYILDQQFMNKLDMGESFSKSDKLIVEIVIDKDVNELTNINSEILIIKKVISHIPFKKPPK